MSDGMPQATSTIWMARFTSVLASSIILPFSVVSVRARSSVCFSRSVL